jgi:predicted choloylglycine hydrolase
MNTEEFLRLIERQRPCPQTLPKALQALWCDKQGDWNQAHEIVQNAKDIDSAWVHAYLHRKEGDLNNAHYWYQRSSQPEFTGELHQEWEHITSFLLKKVNATHGC